MIEFLVLAIGDGGLRRADDEVAIASDGGADDVGQPLSVEHQVVIGGGAKEPVVQINRHLEGDSAMPAREGPENVLLDTGKEALGSHRAEPRELKTEWHLRTFRERLQIGVLAGVDSGEIWLRCRHGCSPKRLPLRASEAAYAALQIRLLILRLPSDLALAGEGVTDQFRARAPLTRIAQARSDLSPAGRGDACCNAV